MSKKELGTYGFWFSDNIENWYKSSKTSMKKRRMLNEFREHENNVTAFKRKHG